MRRVIDVLVAGFSLLLLSPLLLLVALLIKLDSRGPVLFKGPRIGLDGRPFRMWKFRTMVPGAAAGGCITGNGDPRITRLGRLLRRTKLDELPQFLNVITGDMTLVGPRPESPDIVAVYDDRQKQVLRVKPGVTGIVQLNVNEESDSIPPGVDPRAHYIEHMMDFKIRLDLEYLSKRSPLSDAWIVIRTARRVALSVARF